jgi:hypothetical protein
MKKLSVIAVIFVLSGAVWADLAEDFNSNDPAFLFQCYEKYEKESKNKIAMEFLTKSADLGYVKAQLLLGIQIAGQDCFGMGNYSDCKFSSQKEFDSRMKYLRAASVQGSIAGKRLLFCQSILFNTYDDYEYPPATFEIFNELISEGDFQSIDHFARLNAYLMFNGRRTEKEACPWILFAKEEEEIWDKHIVDTAGDFLLKNVWEKVSSFKIPDIMGNIFEKEKDITDLQKRVFYFYENWNIPYIVNNIGALYIDGLGMLGVYDGKQRFEKRVEGVFNKGDLDKAVSVCEKDLSIQETVAVEKELERIRKLSGGKHSLNPETGDVYSF